MANLETFAREITAGAYAQQQTKQQRVGGLYNMALALLLEVVGQEQRDEVRDGLSAILAFVGALAESYTLPMADLLDHAVELVREAESAPTPDEEEKDEDTIAAQEALDLARLVGPDDLDWDDDEYDNEDDAE